MEIGLGLFRQCLERDIFICIGPGGLETVDDDDERLRTMTTCGGHGNAQGDVVGWGQGVDDDGGVSAGGCR